MRFTEFSQNLTKFFKEVFETITLQFHYIALNIHIPSVGNGVIITEVFGAGSDEEVVAVEIIK